MKKYLAIFLLIGMSLISACGQQGGSAIGKKDLPAPKTWQDSISYFIGNQIGKQLAHDSLILNLDYYMKAIADQYAGKTTYFTDDELQTIGDKFNQYMKEKMDAQNKVEEERLKKEAEKNIKLSKKFLDENKKKPGVKETASGMQYKIIKQGNGKKPVMGDIISFHLRGYDIDGNKFDDSYERNEPIQLPLQEGLLPGWVEAFKMMPVGSKWRIWLPANLAFGEQGLPDKVPPQSIAVFEIELLSIDGKAPKQDGMPAQPVKTLPPGM